MTVPDDTQGQVTDALESDTGTGVEQVEESAPQQESVPPWHDFVEKFPTAYRGVAEEAAKEWDAGVTKRFQDLHSTYEPYKTFVDEWEPDAIDQALQIAQALESNPQGFYEALARSYGFGAEQGATEQEQEQVAPSEFEYPEDDPYGPKLQQQEELLRVLAERILGQEEEQKAAQEAEENEQLLDTALGSLRQQYGEYDENYVLNMIANGADPEQAVQSFRSMVDQWASQQNSPASSAPRIMGGGGSIPSAQVDPAQLNSKDTKNLVAEYLRSANGG